MGFVMVELCSVTIMIIIGLDAHDDDDGFDDDDDDNTSNVETS